MTLVSCVGGYHDKCVAANTLLLSMHKFIDPVLLINITENVFVTQYVGDIKGFDQQYLLHCTLEFVAAP